MSEKPIPAPFQFTRAGRSLKTALTLISLWALFAVLYLWFEAHPILIALCMAATLPAAWEFAQNRTASMTLDDRALTWRAGQQERRLPYGKLAAIRLDTRLDLSVRMTCLTTDAQRLRAPLEATPPGHLLETALKARNIPVTRHHFSLTG